LENASESVLGSGGSIDCLEVVATGSPDHASPDLASPEPRSNREDEIRPADDPDVAIVSSAIGGNTEAFDVLFRRYHSLALRTAAIIVGADLAEDVVQDAFLLAFLALPMIRDRSKFPRWLSTITRFRALRLRRSESHRRTRAIALDAARFATLSNIVCASREELEGDEILRAALERIPPEYAEVLRLHFLHEMPHQQIAEFLAVPVSTVKWRCYRGKQMVRCIVHPEGCDLKRVADACRECPSRAAWCADGSRVPLRVASTGPALSDGALGRSTKGPRGKRRVPRRVAELAAWSIGFWSVTDFLQDLLPDALPDLVTDVLPDFLNDLLALLTL
jgi:RNA polymerase sigma-70 factor, ECF subfamily